MGQDTKISGLTALSPSGFLAGTQFPVADPTSSLTLSVRGDVLRGGLLRLRGHHDVTDPKYGADPTGVVNCGSAVQAACDAAGIGGRVYFPPGLYNFGGTQITGYQQQVWEGGYQLGTGSVLGADGRTCLQWTSALGAGNAVVAGVNQVFRRIMFQGAGKLVTTGAAVVSGDVSHSNHTRYDWCQFYDWGTAVNTTNGFYVSFTTCEWARTGIGILATSMFNCHLFNCTARLWDTVTATGGTLFSTSTSVRHLVIHGGSIEGFNASGGIILAGTGSLVDLFGPYFESSVVGSNAVGVDVRANNCTVNAYGCQVYLTEINRWINMSGRDKTTLVAQGNKFECAGTSSTNPIAYVPPTNATGGSIDVGPDDWTDVALAGAVWMSGAINPIPVDGHILAPRTWNATHGNIAYMGRAVNFPAMAAAPASNVVGTIYFADRVNWDPAAKGSGNGYHVAWDGSAWKALY